jgi:hypothetical protein
MSKCENCVSQNVCKWWGNGMGKNLNCTDEVVCPEYKDKSLCVELPCKVGDTLYEICNPKIFNKSIAELKVVAITFLLSSCCNHLAITTENYRGANILLELNDFGKTVFTDKAEAERKLKEIEGK